ncbi:MAG TPA: RagB/SusD family nutrient uptake outer membrane protein, partial [Ignavibacteriaceae bacterium]|nr:RagB/SusD family nutrient uptake outer membrane protein [Ignavibacteriaceae bacterium]
VSLCIMIIVSLTFAACKKYLDKKTDIKLAIPTTLNEFQTLLDQPDITSNSTPGVNDLGCDDYYVSYPTYQSLSVVARNCYIWTSDIWNGATSKDWDNPYSIIYKSNVVLEGLKEFPIDNPQDQAKWNTITGHALFLRGISHYFLEETFGQPYKPSTSNSDMGIPLKLTSDLSKIAMRSSVEATFTQITSDLKEAASLLPTSTGTKNRPSKAAAYGMLARIYLTMQDYVRSSIYADSSLKYNSTLTDYNNVTTLGGNVPFVGFGPPNDGPFEVLYPSNQYPYSVFTQTTVIIDTNLFQLYSINDLRRTGFFRYTASTNSYSFKGNYTGLPTHFSGPAVDEMYLISAECKARAGQKDASLIDLNALLLKRWRNSAGPYSPVTAIDAEDALRKILVERRKELLVRGIRWSDLRRLNQDPRFAITLTRKLNGQIYTLPPNDKKYTYPIPDNEIQLSGIQQNPR